jgi:hypothetical protein
MFGLHILYGGAHHYHHPWQKSSVNLDSEFQTAEKMKAGMRARDFWRNIKVLAYSGLE